ncbi:isocitrate lyase/phosphoenolpyruvate mutase family protein [Pseudonocardia sp. ICBG1034]|uniref:isocitrate lyase/phosphoenolpyruvate mutase family protein n=1 Tax=Pseudonocardia sp. ICBG1034 TaxID=2844381 RepID=UPI001CD0073F|nr:isocitrate lyase/phosphoenolpyruvate mutase family protein [Pseudonocardia sp. ICBG1034]
MLQTDVPPVRRRTGLRAALARARPGARPLRFQTVTTTAAARQVAALGLDGVHVTAATAGAEEPVALTARIVRATPLPVLVDLGGAGGDDDVARFEAAGASGVHLDDTDPTDHAADDVAARVRAAVRARRDPDLLIGVRTTAGAAGGLIETIDRARACVGAGADVIVVEAPASRTAYTVLREALAVPLLVTATTVTGGDPTPVLLPTVTQLAALGMDVVIHPVTGPRAPAATDRGRRDPRDAGTPRGPAGALPPGAHGGDRTRDRAAAPAGGGHR